jgi:hypothetical protein
VKSSVFQLSALSLRQRINRNLIFALFLLVLWMAIEWHATRLEGLWGWLEFFTDIPFEFTAVIAGALCGSLFEHLYFSHNHGQSRTPSGNDGRNAPLACDH